MKATQRKKYKNLYNYQFLVNWLKFKFYEKYIRRLITLKQAIQKGLESPRVENFNFDDNLKRLNENFKKS
jgi:hypothetical protein